MEITTINMCINGHHFLEGKCPFCNGEITEKYEYREGDCIACGQLCPNGLYACDSPQPIIIEK